MKEGTINLQTTVVKWLWIKSTTPQCMQQPFALNVAFFERCVALPPKFRENPPIYVLNNFWKHNIPGGTCSMLFFHVSRIPCQWSSILRMYIFLFLFIYLYIYTYLYVFIFIHIYWEENTRSTPHLCMSIYDVVSNDCKVYMMSFGVNTE